MRHLIILSLFLITMSSYASGPNLVAPPAAPLNTFLSFKSVAGDDHHHSASLLSNFTLYNRQLGSAICPHDFGRPIDVYTMNQNAGFDWLNIAHHDRATWGGMTGKSNGLDVGRDLPGAYQWWTKNSTSPIRLPSGAIFLDPNPNGLPDYVTGGTVSPGYNEALSFSSAAAKKNASSPGFAALAGREFTTNVGTATGVEPGRGGHKIVVLPGASSKICGYLYGLQGDSNECDETELYEWVAGLSGAIIQAHPGDWLSGLTPWNSSTAPAGMSETYVHGVEVANTGGLNWEQGYKNGLGRGYRLFPSFGSDRHKLQLTEFGFGTACDSDGSPDLAYGTVMCWVPNTSAITPSAVTTAMRERRCYYSRSYKPRLEFDLSDSSTSTASVMGSKATVSDGVAQVRIYAQNDVRNQSIGRRFKRLELVQVTGFPAVERVAYSCTNCCTLDGVNGDKCGIDRSVSVTNGALYPRVCGDAASCTATNTWVLGAPIFVNWGTYRTSMGLPAN